MHGIDNATGPDADKKIIKGQALAYRAWAHFQLVQLWGKRYAAGAPNTQPGVPLLLTNTLEGQPRATVEEVYTQVNKDLDDALALLAGYTRTGSAAKSNLNVNVVQGIKARVALTQQKWDIAATSAAAARAGYALMDTVAYLTGFNNITNRNGFGEAVRSMIIILSSILISRTFLPTLIQQSLEPNQGQSMLRFGRQFRKKTFVKECGTELEQT